MIAGAKATTPITVAAKKPSPPIRSPATLR
jgi:hypothetical protein